MAAIRPNFCQTCGGAYAPDDVSRKSVSTNCATCRRRLLNIKAPRRGQHARLRIIAFCGAIVLAAVIFRAWMITDSSVPVFAPAERRFPPREQNLPSPMASVPAVPTLPAVPAPTFRQRFFPSRAIPVPETPAPVTPAPAAIRARRAPVVPPIVHDPKRDSWKGYFLLQTRANVASIFINGKSAFSSEQAGVYMTPGITLHRSDLVMFEVAAPSSVMRAAFVTSDGKQQIPLHAADLRDLGDKTAATPIEFAAYHDAPGAVGKVTAAEVTEWETAGAQPVPHGSEYVNGKSTDTYHLGFIVSGQMFRPLRTGQLTDRKLYLFDDKSRMASDWKWKANFTMNADGATGPQEADNELVSRFLLDGDFTVDLDADFGQAIYTNTGGMLVAVCKQEIGFDGGWNFGSWGGSSVHIRVQRLGDELQLIRDGQVLIVPVPDAERREPTPWRLWWRSRSSHFHGIKVSAERIIDAKAPVGFGR